MYFETRFSQSFGRSSATAEWFPYVLSLRVQLAYLGDDLASYPTLTALILHVNACQASV